MDNYTDHKMSLLELCLWEFTKNAQTVIILIIFHFNVQNVIRFAKPVMEGVSKNV